MTQIQNSKNNDSKFWKFDHLRLGFVSDFDIRISDFVQYKTCLVLARPEKGGRK